MVRKKMMFGLLLALFLTGTALAGQNWLIHGLPEGRLLDALALPEGQALTLTAQTGESPTLTLSLYAPDGNLLDEAVFAQSSTPEAIIWQVCGGYVQVFTHDDVEGGQGINTRYLWRPAIPLDCEESRQVFLPWIGR